ncbi:hypothetical protein [Nocardia vaccinii]|uniref:hypothetical protein n=1 Tax=Nocardia vaccinii TaxID=1822 RepID=UPI00082C4954|nr:hypothetical protein [Nocardia vaccinii]
MITLFASAAAICVVAAVVAIHKANMASAAAELARQRLADANAEHRRAAEKRAADPAPLEIDRGNVRPLRIVHLHERDEQLAGAIRRHPAGGAR